MNEKDAFIIVATLLLLAYMLKRRPKPKEDTYEIESYVMRKEGDTKKSPAQVKK